ncbi:membrane-bound lytic murein transglycosylase MltC [Ferrimonas senticii]|uniref:membrane-bound lytic murein transglycosylase MltC n=1 Tax=Ferrimonas senticii TaxID=394566 RepID=UPI000483B005|nr:membrane-bound lytic murein transglycosylase MltC [Ferrimonas senticii]
MRVLLPLTLLATLAGCAQTPDPEPCVCEPAFQQPSYSECPSVTSPSTPSADQIAFTKLMQYLANKVKQEWGEDEYLVAGKHHYVKYIDSYRTRAHIDFDKGKIWVATIAQDQPKTHLQQAIVETLLMPADPSKVDLFSDKNIAASGKPFLLGQVVDHDGKPIEWQWRANRYANYLLENRLSSKPVRRGKVYYVEIDMVSDHESQREYQYAHLIRDAAKRYNLSEDLIYAIVKTESSFNPYAVSHAGAYGLMQVIPKTAGADVFNLVKGRNDIPTKEYLFDPASNIDTGAAYFHILKTRYLKEVQNSTSLHYSMISAYNGGTGGVLSTFDSDRKQAMRELNALHPNQLYTVLTTQHPKAEARRYLEKVLKFQKEFNQGTM